MLVVGPEGAIYPPLESLIQGYKRKAEGARGE